MARFNPSSALRLRLILFLIPCLFSFCRPFDRLTAQTGNCTSCYSTRCALLPVQLCCNALLSWWDRTEALLNSSRTFGILRGSRWGVDSAVPWDSSEELAHREKLFFLFFCCVICNVNSYVCYCLTPPAAYFRTASAQQFPHNSINGLKIGLPRLSLLQH